MTSNQINMLRHLEEVRHNSEVERESHRSNVAREEETQRSNLAMERFNMLGLQEQSRHNVRSELIDIARVRENERSNKAREKETNRSNIAKETEIYRHNSAQEFVWNEKLPYEKEQLKSSSTSNYLGGIGNVIKSGVSLVGGVLSLLG